MGLLFECPTHRDLWEECLAGTSPIPDCEDCKRIIKLAKKNQEAAKRKPKIPKLRSSVYWPSRMIHEGRVIENLSHRPQYVKNKDQYRDLLKRTGSQEAG